MPDFNKTINLAEQKLGANGILGLVNGNDNRYKNFINKKGYERINLGNSVYVPNKNILIINGQEIFTKQGHLLVIGLSENQRIKLKDLEDSLKQARDNNSIIIAPHPFFFQGIGSELIHNPKLLKYFDAIEINNGEAIYGNKKTKMFYKLIKEDYDIGALSSSDGHSLYEIGSNYTLLENPEKDINKLRKSIKQHKDYSSDKQKFSFLGFAKHSFETIGYMGFSKLGIIKSNFSKNLL